MAVYQLAGNNEMETPQCKLPAGMAGWLWHLLDTVEDRVWAMLHGVWQFLTSAFPRWLMRVLREFLQVGYKLARVGLVVSLWVGLTFIPSLVLFRGPALLVMMGWAWLAVALGGSCYGLLYIRHRLRQQPLNGSA